MRVDAVGHQFNGLVHGERLSEMPDRISDDLQGLSPVDFIVLQQVPGHLLERNTLLHGADKFPATDLTQSLL
jgi:hypothetical protein